MISSTESAKTTVRLLPTEETQPRSTRIPYPRSINWSPIYKVDQVPEPVVSVFMTRPALWECVNEAQSDMDNEVGGWLLGKWRVDKVTNEQFVIVDTVLPVQYAIHGSSFLRFTQKSQMYLRNRMDEEFPDKDLVGWFHTHPKMSVFLSNYDTWLHENFFQEPWQIALVIEPHSKTAGFFIRKSGGGLDPRLYYGFHELADGMEQSVVEWKNLVPRVHTGE